MPSGDNMKRSAVTAYRNGRKSAESRHGAANALNTGSVINPHLLARILLVVEFDRRFLLSEGDPLALLELAAWADDHKLTLGRKARQAAQA